VLFITGTDTGVGKTVATAAIGWARERHVGGVPVAEYQGVQWMLADMATDIAAARALGLAAAARRERGERYSQQAAMAKLFASEMVDRVTNLALQIHGGYGYTSGLPLERYVRDCRVFRIFEGSSEIQRNIIARDLIKE